MTKIVIDVYDGSRLVGVVRGTNGEGFDTVEDATRFRDNSQVLVNTDTKLSYFDEFDTHPEFDANPDANYVAETGYVEDVDYSHAEANGWIKTEEGWFFPD